MENYDSGMDNIDGENYDEGSYDEGSFEEGSYEEGAYDEGAYEEAAYWSQISIPPLQVRGALSGGLRMSALPG